MPYYRLVQPDRGENIWMRRDSHRQIFHTDGTPIDPAAVDLPFRVVMHVGEESGYDQYDPDFEGEIQPASLEDRLLDFYAEAALMSPALVGCLRQAGVDDLQVFPVVVTHATTGEVLAREFLFVNIVASVACASLDRSTHDPLGEAHVFHDLVIDERRAQGLLFRLAESPGEIIVAEPVARAIERGGFRGLVAEALPSIGASRPFTAR